MAGLVVDEPEDDTEEDCYKEEVREIEALVCSTADSSCDELDINLLETTDRLSICKYETDTIDDCLCTQSAINGGTLSFAMIKPLDSFSLFQCVFPLKNRKGPGVSKAWFHI